MSGARLHAHGLAVALPPRWEGRIYLRATPTADPDTTEVDVGQALGVTARRDSSTPHAAGIGWAGERPHPVLHLANFALPAGRGDFGTGAVEVMGPKHIFLALLEFGSECLGTALYAQRGLPRPRPDDFHPATLQRRLPGQAGYQAFFTEGGRPLCLFVVLGAHAQRHRLCPQVCDVLDRVEVTPWT